MVHDGCHGGRKRDGAGEGLELAGNVGDVVVLHGTLAVKTRYEDKNESKSGRK